MLDADRVLRAAIWRGDFAMSSAIAASRKQRMPFRERAIALDPAMLCCFLSIW